MEVPFPHPTLDLFGRLYSLDNPQHVEAFSALKADLDALEEISQAQEDVECYQPGIAYNFVLTDWLARPLSFGPDTIVFLGFHRHPNGKNQVIYSVVTCCQRLYIDAKPSLCLWGFLERVAVGYRRVGISKIGSTGLMYSVNKWPTLEAGWGYIYIGNEASLSRCIPLSEKDTYRQNPAEKRRFIFSFGGHTMLLHNDVTPKRLNTTQPPISPCSCDEAASIWKRFFHASDAFLHDDKDIQGILQHPHSRGVFSLSKDGFDCYALLWSMDWLSLKSPTRPVQGPVKVFLITNIIAFKDGTPLFLGKEHEASQVVYTLVHAIRSHVKKSTKETPYFVIECENNQTEWRTLFTNRENGYIGFSEEVYDTYTLNGKYFQANYKVRWLDPRNHSSLLYFKDPDQPFQLNKNVAKL